jgi:hypothetical protein
MRGAETMIEPLLEASNTLQDGGDGAACRGERTQEDVVRDFRDQIQAQSDQARRATGGLGQQVLRGFVTTAACGPAVTTPHRRVFPLQP